MAMMCVLCRFWRNYQMLLACDYDRGVLYALRWAYVYTRLRSPKRCVWRLPPVDPPPAGADAHEKFAHYAGKR